MICKKCGEEIADDSKFCPVCGAKIEAEAPVEAAPATEIPVEASAEEAPAAEAQPAAEATPAAAPTADSNVVPTTVDPSVAAKATGKKIADALRKVPAKVWGIAAAAVIAIIVICNIVSCANNKSPFITASAKDQIIYAAKTEVITSSGKTINIDERIVGYEYNYNQTVMAVLDMDNVLWAVNTKKATKVAEDVSSFKISFYGDTIVYKVKDGNEYSLYTYDVAKKKSKKIYDDNCSEFTISSNGKNVAFRNSEGDIFVSKKGATASKERSEARPIGISNDGKRLFYTKSDKFCVNDDKLISYDYLGYFFFNIEGNEVVFGANGNTYYVSSKATEATKVKGSTLSGVIVPENTAAMGDDTVYTYGVSSFNGIVLNIGGSAYYVSKNGESAEKIISDCSDYVMSSDGKSIIYISDGDIYKVANVKKAGEPKKIGKNSDAKCLFASDDFKNIYYVTSDKELRYLKKDGKGELIADDIVVLSYWGVSYAKAAYDSSIKGVVYVTSDCEVFTAQTSKKSKQKLTVGDANSISVVGNGDATYAIVTDEDDNVVIYKVASTKKVKKLATVEVENNYK